jgi:hypothetical protein
VTERKKISVTINQVTQSFTTWEIDEPESLEDFELLMGNLTDLEQTRLELSSHGEVFRLSPNDKFSITNYRPGRNNYMGSKSFEVKLGEYVTDSPQLVMTTDVQVLGQEEEEDGTLTPYLYYQRKAEANDAAS